MASVRRPPRRQAGRDDGDDGGLSTDEEAGLLESSSGEEHRDAAGASAAPSVRRSLKGGLSQAVKDACMDRGVAAHPGSCGTLAWSVLAWLATTSLVMGFVLLTLIGPRVTQEPELCERGPRALVFTSVSSESRLESHWMSSPDDAKFDVFVVARDADAPAPDPTLVAHFVRRDGTKLDNLNAMMSQFPEVFESYDFVACLDEDIELDTAAINSMFRTMCSYGLDLAQPAFETASDTPWKSSRVMPLALLHYTNYVDVAAIVFSRDALFRVREVFTEADVVYGTDYVMCEMVQAAGGRVAVIDSTPTARGELSGLGTDAVVLSPDDPRRQAAKNMLRRHGLLPKDEDGPDPVAAEYLPRVRAFVVPVDVLLALSVLSGTALTGGTVVILFVMLDRNQRRDRVE